MKTPDSVVADQVRGVEVQRRVVGDLFGVHKTDDRPKTSSGNLVHPTDYCVRRFRWQVAATSAELAMVPEWAMCASKQPWDDPDYELRLVASVQSTPESSECCPDSVLLVTERI